MTLAAAHHHMLAVLSTEVASSGLQAVRVLDAGCGDGGLLLVLHERLPALHPGVRFDLFGFDVSDSAVQESGYLSGALASLHERAPGVDWNERIRVVGSTEPWPFDPEQFDYVLSNQVLEHVADHAHFFSAMRRVLRTGGSSIHLCPLRHVLYEPHLHMPPVHWIREYDSLRSAILWASRLGFGAYRQARARGLETTRARYAESRADYILFETNYRSRGEMLVLAKQHHLRCSFRYTEAFYTNRLRMLLGLPPQIALRASRHAFLHGMLVRVLMWLSSVTIVLEKKSLQVPAQPMVWK